VAEGAIARGRVGKVIGFVLGALLLGVGLVGLAGLGGGAVSTVALLAAVIVTLIGSIAGDFITAQGQMISSTLDIVINTSSLRAGLRDNSLGSHSARARIPTPVNEGMLRSVQVVHSAVERL